MTQKLLALDTETTGVDFYHGARPYLVTMCSEIGGQPWHYEWEVDPLTRMVIPDPRDTIKIREYINSASRLYLQNAKFDVTALAIAGIYTDPWPWHKTFDTLVAGHVLGSNESHNLTDMAAWYLRVEIQEFEDALEDATRKARSWCQSDRYGLQDWLIANDDVESMPSFRNMKDSKWKVDAWLPKTIAQYLSLPQNHEFYRWNTVLSEYANSDSMTTIALGVRLEELLRKRKLYRIYEERVKVIKIAQEMEWNGTTMIVPNVEELLYDYQEDSKISEQVCVNIAESYDYSLTLPKQGVNDSLRQFMLGTLQLEPIKNAKAKTDNGSLDKNALAFYKASAERGSKESLFINNLLLKRARDTSIQFLHSYQRFAVPSVDGYFTIHPNLNPTGTDTLRWSCNNPNEMNISKKEMICPTCLGDRDDCEECGGTGLDKRTLRRCLGPTPDREYYTFDAKNIERRIPAYEANEEEIINLFERPNDPPYYGSEHLMIAHTLHEKAFEECCWNGEFLDGRLFKKKYADTLYQWTKNGNFAVQYNAQQKTAERAYKVPGAFPKIKSRFSRQEALNQQCIRFADKHGYVETIPDRTVDPTRGYPLLCTRAQNGRISPTVPLNYHVSGTAMWWMQMAMIRVHEQLEEWRRDRCDCRIEMQIHDELVISFPRREHPLKNPKKSNLWRAKRIQQLMEVNGNNLVIPIPTPVSIEYCEHNWSEGATCA